LFAARAEVFFLGGARALGVAAVCDAAEGVFFRKRIECIGIVVSGLRSAGSRRVDVFFADLLYTCFVFVFKGRGGIARLVSAKLQGCENPIAATLIRK
jgi:hypothetical protein